MILEGDEKITQLSRKENVKTRLFMLREKIHGAANLNILKGHTKMDPNPHFFSKNIQWVPF